MKKTFSVNTIRLLAGGILALSCLSATAQEQPAVQQPQQVQLPRQPEAFIWQTHVLTTGDTFKAVYRPPVPLNTPVKGYIYYFQNFAWHGYDFPLVKTDTGWLVSGIVPEGAAAMAFRFYLGDTLDRGERWPYMILIHDKNKQMMPGAYTEYAVIRRPNSQGMMSELVTKQSQIEAKVAVQLYISREWSNMQVRRNMFYPMALAIKDYFSPGKTDSVLRSGIAEIAALPDVTEKELITVQRVFDRILHNRTSADSMGRLIMAKYPGGLFAREKQLYDVFRKMMETKQIQPWYDFLKTYPQEKYPFNDYLDPVTGDIAYFFKCFTYEAGYYFNNHNWEGLRKMSSYTPVSLLPYMYMHYVMYPFRYSVETIPAAEAFTLSKVYMADIISHINSKDSIVSDRGLFAASEWPGTYMRKEFTVFTYHAKLLYDNGEYAAAMQLSRMLQPNIGFIDVSFNDVYVKLLVREKKNKEALEYIKQAVHANAFTGDMIKVLKADYLKNKGDEKAFPAYVISLKSKESVEKEQEAIRRAMVSVPSPDFDLADSKGDKVSLAAQKGKIVVLDFWATWCYPCKLAMPGMQMAVERFKQEKDVAFYFISTLEKHPRYKQMADSFVIAKKFDFRVIFDNKTDSSQLPDQTYEAFRKVLHFNGIPEKVIIDQNGVIRWWSSGGSDNHIALAEEIAYVIELLKKEQEAAKVAPN